MQIISNRFGIDIKEVLEVFDPLPERYQRFQVLQVANVMTEKGLLPFSQAEGVLEVRAARQHRYGKLQRERDWLRRIPSRAPQELRIACRGPHDRIIAPHVDVAIVCQHSVSDCSKSAKCVVVTVGDWLVAQVATGHHQRNGSILLKYFGTGAQQEVVQWRVR